MLVFVLAFAFRLGLAVAFPNFGVAAPGEMERIAQSFATTGQLANPYLTTTGPTAHVAPLYPILIGSIYSVFGSGDRGRFVQTIFSCVMAALRCALIIPLTILLGLGFRTGCLAAALSTLYISAFNTELRGWWEAPLCALAVMAAVALAKRFDNQPEFSIRTAAGYGLFAGAALSLSPPLLLMLATLLLLTAKPGLRAPRAYALWLGGIIVTAALVLLPWTIRNARVLGSPIVFRSNFGLELSLAYNDSQQASAMDPGIVSTHPLHNVAVSEEVARLGEVSFNRNRQRQATEWIEAHPLAAARLMVRHAFYFWFPPAENIIVRLIFAGLTLFALAGLVTMYRLNARSATLIALVWITFPLIYYITYWSSRYRYPMEWTLVLCSAVLIEQLWQRLRGKSPARQ